MNAVSEKAIVASAAAKLPRSYWDWGKVMKMNEKNFFPYTPPTNLLFGLDAALELMLEEGMENLFARHKRLAQATRKAVHAWGLEMCCLDPDALTDSLTAVWMPEGHDADEVRKLILERFDLSLGTGLGKVKGKLFRIGHLGDMNDLMLVGTLGGVEMGLGLAGVPHTPGGVAAAMEYLAQTAS
jgi:alanine-glyoxylate transaminase/serine-glyoxylate transaminase/serine-pyruvate transaminase